ncbi:unnamed protein product [Lepidochelys kempii]
MDHWALLQQAGWRLAEDPFLPQPEALWHCRREGAQLFAVTLVTLLHETRTVTRPGCLAGCLYGYRNKQQIRARPPPSSTAVWRPGGSRASPGSLPQLSRGSSGG